MRILKLNRHFFRFVRDLRWHPETVEGFVDQEKPSWEDHVRYMEAHLDDYYVGVIAFEPVGFVGCVEGDVRVCVHPSVQGLGYGSMLLRFARKRWPGGVMKIKFDNMRSFRVGLGAGYKPAFYILK